MKSGSYYIRSTHCHIQLTFKLFVWRFKTRFPHKNKGFESEAATRGGLCKKVFLEIS